MKKEFYNDASMVCIIKENGKEYIEFFGVKRPILKVYCHDNHHELTEVKVVLSDMGMIRKGSGFHPGDIVFLQGSIKELENGKPYFLPQIFWIIDKYEEDAISEVGLKCRLDMYFHFKNRVFLSGNITEKKGNTVTLHIPDSEIVRGEEFGARDIHINTCLPPEAKDYCHFIGYFSKGGIYGEAFL